MLCRWVIKGIDDFMANLKGKRVKLRRFVDDNNRDEIVPKEPWHKGRFLAIICRRNKSCIWVWVLLNKHHFSIDGHTYIRDPKGIYISKNKILFSLYMEGISIPISHEQIKEKIVSVPYIDPISKEQRKMDITTVNELKFDSSIVDIFVNRHLADEFTRTYIDKTGMGVLLLLIVNIVVGIIGIGVQFYV